MPKASMDFLLFKTILAPLFQLKQNFTKLSFGDVLFKTRWRDAQQTYFHFKCIIY